MAASKMNDLERKLLKEAIGDSEPSICLCTKTKVDAGRWGPKSRLWLCIAEGRLVLLSVARRMYVDCIPLSECVGSEYCHATGELVIKPVEGLEFDKVAMSPADALKVLAEIEAGVRGSRSKVELRAAAETGTA